ncbi:unnamed protein product [Effrenium voratum]|nr:unnamed protein product [Effrenium voratum]
MSRHAVACRAAALSFLVFAASWAFTPLTGSSSGGRAIGTSSRRALEEDQEERVPFKVPAAEGDYVVRIAQASNVSKATRYVTSQLQAHGQVVLDCLGPNAVQQGLRVLQREVNLHKEVLGKLGGSLALYPHFVETKEDKISVQIHARPVAFQPCTSDLLRAPAEDKITKLASSIVARIENDGCARVAALGKEKLYLTLKALMRANIFVARNAIDANEEAEPLWAVPSLETLEGMEMMSTVLTVVKGPPL